MCQHYSICGTRSARGVRKSTPFARGIRSGGAIEISHVPVFVVKRMSEASSDQKTLLCARPCAQIFKAGPTCCSISVDSPFRLESAPSDQSDLLQPLMRHETRRTRLRRSGLSRPVEEPDLSIATAGVWTAAHRQPLNKAEILLGIRPVGLLEPMGRLDPLYEEELTARALQLVRQACFFFFFFTFLHLPLTSL